MLKIFVKLFICFKLVYFFTLEKLTSDRKCRTIRHRTVQAMTIRTSQVTPRIRKPFHCDSLSAPGGPGTLLTDQNSLNLSSIIVQTASEAKTRNPQSSSPKKSPTKAPAARGRSDKPPQNARPYSPRKNKSYLDFDGPDSDEECDGALMQVYKRVG